MENSTESPINVIFKMKRKKGIKMQRNHTKLLEINYTENPCLHKA